MRRKRRKQVRPFVFKLDIFKHLRGSETLDKMKYRRDSPSEIVTHRGRGLSPHPSGSVTVHSRGE